MKKQDDDAPTGSIWVCAACGKTAPNRLGGPGSDQGWDVSCCMNSMLCRIDSLVRDKRSGRVIKVETTKIKFEAH